MNQCFDYWAAQPDAIIRYKASDTILILHSGASNLSEPLSKRRSGGNFYLTNKDNRDIDNGAILTLFKSFKFVMGSAGKSEVVALYYNCKGAIPHSNSSQRDGS